MYLHEARQTDARKDALRPSSKIHIGELLLRIATFSTTSVICTQLMSTITPFFFFYFHNPVSSSVRAFKGGSDKLVKGK